MVEGILYLAKWLFLSICISARYFIINVIVGCFCSLCSVLVATVILALPVVLKHQ